MKGFLAFVLSVATFLSLHPQLAARPPGKAKSLADRNIGAYNPVNDQALADRRGLFVSSAIDTYVLAEFDFGLIDPDPQGWVSVDRHEQEGTFFHVDDFAGLGGGESGRLAPLHGQKSLWCGSATRPLQPECDPGCYPGYGDDWDQRFESVAFPALGDVFVSFQIRYDSEPGYDFTYLDYKYKYGYWRRLLTFDDTGDSLVSVMIPEDNLPGSVQIRFRFESDYTWSDADCLWPTDGAVIIDNLRIMDATGTIDFQDFEIEPAGALTTADGDWSATAIPPYGDYAALYPGVLVLQEDPCTSRWLYIWGFFDDSRGYNCHTPDPKPDQGVIPYGTPDGLYMSNEIWSPEIDWNVDINGNPIPATASSALLEFDVYRDLPLDYLLFYVWHIRSVTDGCPGDWKDRNFVYYGGRRDWLRFRHGIADLVSPSTEKVQIALGCRDMCFVWCWWYGSGGCHSQGPLFDNVRLVRIDHVGPIWSVNDFDLFQDNFAADGTTTGAVRIDMAADILPYNSPGVRPGDSTCVTVTATNFGLGFHTEGDPASGPAVYCHVEDIDPAKSGEAITGDPYRWPVVGTGDNWTALRFDSAFGNDGTAVENRYCVDLNDNLYTPGDTIWFYFSARDAAGNTTYWSRFTGAAGNEMVVRSSPMEMTCLPANAADGATDILYVDAFDRSSTSGFFDSAFEVLGISPDRYDIRASTSLEHNGPGTRVVNVSEQVTSKYKTIIWDSGNVSTVTINNGPGSGYGGKSDDFGLLFEFLDTRPDNPGLYLTGDAIAANWVYYGAGGAASLRNTYLDFAFVRDDHVRLGQPLSPLVVGQPGSFFDDADGPDSLIAYGGCPVLRRFDVLAATGASSVASAYSNDPSHGAVISQATTNSSGGMARAVFSGFGYDAIHDDRVQFPPDRVEHLRDILVWFDNLIDLPTSVEPLPQFVNDLAQNYPNPFNPATRIRYSIKQRSHVTLKIYNVKGQLVRTLVDGLQDPKPEGFVVGWDGKSSRGQMVASGVYFYRLAAKKFSDTKKMVMLR
jgi:hypothetical protein